MSGNWTADLNARAILTRAAHLPALTSLRFVAALSVMMHHLIDFTPHAPHVAFATRASLAVDFFFILSGYIMTHVHGEEARRGLLSWGAFLRSRLARIYPTHLFVIPVFVATVALARGIGLAINEDRYSLRSLATHLLLINGWGFDHYLSWNAPAWSVSAEWGAYLGFIPLAWAATRLKAAQAAVALAVLLAAFLWLAPRYDLTQRTLESLPRIYPGFLMGMLARRIFVPTPSRTASVAFVVACLIVAAGLQLGWPDAWIVVVFPFLIAAAAGLEGPVAAAMAWRPLVRLGAQAYSIYLVHMFAFGVMFNLGAIRARFGVSGWTLTAATMMVSILAGSALHRFVEAPAYKRWSMSARAG